MSATYDLARIELSAIRAALARESTESALMWLDQLERTIAAYEALYSNQKRRKAS